MKSVVFSAAIGDALGMPAEGLKREEIKKLYGFIEDYEEPKNYLKGKKERGEWTDDTDQALALIDGIEDINIFIRKLIEWKNRNPPDIGLTSLKAIEKLERGDLSGVDSPSSGAAMRIYPIGLVCKDLDGLKRKVILYSKITHNNKDAIAGALAIAYLVFKEEKDLDGCIKFLENFNYKFSKLLERIKSLKAVEEAYQLFGTGVLAYEVVPSAIATFILEEDFEEGLLKCVNAGGDTDTLASIYGALAGSYYKRVPKRYLKGLKNKEILEEKVKKLLSLF
ncbi:ADP-ribosylation/Crystallin J1 [Methanocaldococcus infernus ME]|uniref:ADP-ribosylation/Crystallin J1 n=1 Tax=Methanocaldococcus infernus (strain DSM 11812 / JCM 15783 / ME) TaxID=573063 RepID=D5VSU4_METIM|nr:ADP-ribosylglycohydrolase family protein [Methanocaldococcus infernus]ADG13647.1 ADP-ribosylation/Crystallin J1 [Methanocaldococcus infernus ME]